MDAEVRTSFIVVFGIVGTAMVVLSYIGLILRRRHFPVTSRPLR